MLAIDNSGRGSGGLRHCEIEPDPGEGLVEADPVDEPSRGCRILASGRRADAILNERTWSATVYLTPIADRSRSAFVYPGQRTRGAPWVRGNRRLAMVAVARKLPLARRRDVPIPAVSNRSRYRDGEGARRIR
jgi:hypothetical protein